MIFYYTTNHILTIYKFYYRNLSVLHIPERFRGKVENNNSR